MGGDEEEATAEEYGVLLYYKYTPPIEDLNALYHFYHSNCTSLSLLGRVRLSPHGVNVGGNLSALEAHISAVKENRLFDGTDFKLASCTQPLNDKVAEECGFTSLSIRIVKELVTLSSNPLLKLPTVSNAGKHLSAIEFHSIVSAAASGTLFEEEGPVDGKKVFLLDARNLYETRIGKFETQNVETLDPGIRQYSDLPTWIDDNTEKLRGSHVLMYCTGGIRCEMASAYIRSKGAGFENVFQLYGGIQRYLEQFPDGGHFKGKNFVFDPRISVGSTSGCILGKCLLCGSPYDDYSLRCRCTFCRMLVLVCNDCQKESIEYVCEICKRHQIVAECGQTYAACDFSTRTSDLGCDFDVQKGQLLSDQAINQSHASCNPGLTPSRKLRILCLHGFRQNASSFKGRTASLAKKLKSIAELVFVNAPYELPFVYQPIRKDNEPCLPKQDPPPLKSCNKKYAWLVADSFHSRSQEEWDKTDMAFDALQYRQQTEGFEESLSYLKSVFSQQGPFDGILGFSQGAAMTALICAERGRLEQEMGLRFAIMCSGFAVNLSGSEKSPINFPSLHVFGSGSVKDRQIASDCSRDLALVFEEGSRGRTSTVTEALPRQQSSLPSQSSVYPGGYPNSCCLVSRSCSYCYQYLER
ncbi:hypothetical protein V2J09_022587 [Rumex salicifolius]